MGNDTPITDALFAKCQSMSEAGRTLVNHARRMERDRAELMAALERCLSQLDGYESDDDLECVAAEGDKCSHDMLVTRTSARSVLSRVRGE